MSHLFKKSTRERNPLTKKRIIVSGPQGGGKSTLIAGIAAHVEKVIYIDAEDGLAENFDGLSILLPKTWPEIEESVQLAIDSEAEVVVFDSWSRAYGRCRDHVMKEKGWTTEDDGGSHGKGYGVIRAEFARVIMPLYGLKDHGRGLVIVAHEKIVTLTKPTGDITLMQPDIQGPAGIEAGRIFDMILVYDVEQSKTGVQHVLYSANDGFHVAKDRTGWMPARTVIPKMTGDNDQRASGVWKHINDTYEGIVA